jgi:two-component system, OmpR family, sensor histidine kinase RstB
MLRLYLRFYVALLASLVVLGIAIAIVWRLAGGPMDQAGATLSRVIENILPAAQAPASEQQEALRRLSAGLESDVTLLDANGRFIASVGVPLPPPDAMPRHTLSFAHSGRGALSEVRLADGRLLIAAAPMKFSSARAVSHLVLIALIAAIGVAAFPIFRQLASRLERLQYGVDSLGAGDLSTRVAVEGTDEVARLAKSFNRAASQIEALVKSHRTMLANASHELRTPLARIRLAAELLKGAADPKIKSGLEQDIAELDGLLDEILLAARLDAVQTPEVIEELDLLATAAEECARHDDVHLEGTPQKLRGDARLLRRLLRNLLDNAERHGSPPIQMRISRDGDFAIVRVWDNGPGPTQDEFERVFAPFYRRRDALAGTGTGLGLSLVRQIARRHGGDARCEMIDDARSGFVVTLAG